MDHPIPERRVALSFLAHPDDAEILCAGTLIHLSKLGWEIHIATATAGDCGSTELSCDEIAQIRYSEAEVSAKLINATYHCLGLRDVNVIFEHTSNRLAIDLFRTIAPTLVITHPRCDYMMDHEQVHLLARSAAFSYPIPNASELPLANGGMIPWLYYCDPIDGTDPYNGARIKPSVAVDISEVIDRKVEMLACHDSQREWLRRHHGMDEYIEAMKRHGRLRGKELGSDYAESFVQHRGHAFPQTDLLQQILGGI